MECRKEVVSHLVTPHGTLLPMPAKHQFEAQIAQLDAVRDAPEGARVDTLRKALAHRNNFIVAKAADFSREFNLQELVPDLLKGLRSLL